MCKPCRKHVGTMLQLRRHAAIGLLNYRQRASLSCVVPHTTGRVRLERHVHTMHWSVQASHADLRHSV
jgi:hypothetical protein